MDPVALQVASNPLDELVIRLALRLGALEQQNRLLEAELQQLRRERERTDAA